MLWVAFDNLCTGTGMDVGMGVPQARASKGPHQDLLKVGDRHEEEDAISERARCRGAPLSRQHRELTEVGALHRQGKKVEAERSWGAGQNTLRDVCLQAQREGRANGRCTSMNTATRGRLLRISVGYEAQAATACPRRVRADSWGGAARTSMSVE